MLLRVGVLCFCLGILEVVEKSSMKIVCLQKSEGGVAAGAVVRFRGRAETHLGATAARGRRGWRRTKCGIDAKN